MSPFSDYKNTLLINQNRILLSAISSTQWNSGT